MGCTKDHISAEFTQKMVTVKCKECNIQMELPSLLYFQKWGYPKGTERLSVFDWLHEIERGLGRKMMEKYKVSFRDTVNNVILGSSVFPRGSVEKLNIGDRVEFKEVGAVFGMFEIISFAINEGCPEGEISLKPIKSKAKIKLQQINDAYVDSLLPF